MDTTTLKQLIFSGYFFYRACEKNCMLQTGISIYCIESEGIQSSWLRSVLWEPSAHNWMDLNGSDFNGKK